MIKILILSSFFISQLCTKSILNYSLLKGKTIKEQVTDQSLLAMHLYDASYDKIIELQANDKTYQLCLNEDIISISSGVISNIPLGNLKTYVGNICDEPSTFVRGSIMDDIFHGEILDKNGIKLYLEDSFKYNDIIKNCPNCHTIMYQQSDINYSHYEKNPIRCGVDSRHLFNLTSEILKGGSIKKQQSSEPLSGKIYCKLSILLHEEYISRYSSSAAALAQISMHINELNARLRDQIQTGKNDLLQYSITQIAKFGNEIPGISKFLGDPNLLLQISSTLSKGIETCATGVYVNRDWKGVLGLAYVGNKEGKGICNNAANYVITMTIFGSPVAFPIHKVSTIHEIGHTLGSIHDPTSTCNGCDKKRIAECSPPKGYIMSEFANDGNDPNNLIYSPCSVEAIRSLIGFPSRRHCLEADISNVCGNGIVEAGEECDGGFDSDPCCGIASSSNPCKIIKGECSGSNGICCDANTCEYLQNDNVCINETNCAMKSLCNGTSAVCPKQIYKSDNTSCENDLAVCFNGICSKSACILFNQHECECGDAQACQICCSKSGSQSDCKPFEYSDKTTKNKLEGFICKLSDGTGFCDDTGSCKKLNTLPPVSDIFGLLLSGELFTKIKRFFFDYLELFIILVTAFIMLMSGITRVFNVEHERLYKNIIRRRSTAITNQLSEKVFNFQNEDNKL